jgi:hypothetical protein
MLMPEALWEEVRGAAVLYVVAHGMLHSLPLEALLVREREGQPVWWLDEGPPVAYVPSGSVLAWLRERRAAQEAGGGPARLVAVGDPVFAAPVAARGTGAPQRVAWPEAGVLVTTTPEGGQAHALGIRPGDVLVRYAGGDLTDPVSLRARIEAAIATGGTGPFEVRVWREGGLISFEAAPGRLGVTIALEPPPIAGPIFLARSPLVARPIQEELRSGLAPLPGTRVEVGAIHAVLAEKDGEAVEIVTLLGPDATEVNLFEAVSGARYLHLATHGLVDESETASFSALALAKPMLPVPGNDGFLTLVDLLGKWRAHLKDTRMVVLSACDTQRGHVQRDDGVVALPWGFHFAGCPTVVATLWKVSDASTPLLMERFYRDLMARDGAGRLDALLAAKKALRQTHPHPFHWAPFVLLGDPR